MIWLFLNRRSPQSHRGGCVNRPTESRRWCSLRYVSETHLGEVTYVPLGKWYINCLEPVSPKHSDSYQCSISRTVLCRSQYRELFAALTNSCVQAQIRVQDCRQRCSESVPGNSQTRSTTPHSKVSTHSPYVWGGVVLPTSVTKLAHGIPRSQAASYTMHTCTE